MLTETILRKHWKRNEIADNARIAAQKPPEGVAAVIDLSYIDDGNPDHLLDVYYPEGTTEKLPVVVNIHGGGWTYGEKRINKYFAMEIAARGFAVVGINYPLIYDYRLSDEFRAIFSACNWVLKNEKGFPFDLENIFVTGDSAGGHLAVITAALSRSPEWKQKLGIESEISFRAAASICGALYLDKYEKKFYMRGIYRMMFGEKGRNDELSALAYPVRLIKDGACPPVFMNTATKDFVREHSVKFAEFLEKEGVPHELIVSEGLTHVFNVLNPTWDESVRVNDAMCDFLRRYLK
jgi:acetyl esterase/lipase